MNNDAIRTITQLEQFIKGFDTTVCNPAHADTETIYQCIEDELNKWRYWNLRRKDKGAVKAYLEKITGYSRSQITRLIMKKTRTGVVRRASRTQPTFRTRYTRTDIERLADIDNLYQRPSGPALRAIVHDEWVLYGNRDFERLSTISSSHIYNLRDTDRYRTKSLVVAKTKSVDRNIGIRMKPEPEGKPGYIRVDTVHQGDLDKVKGVYHIHLVDEVTQWDITVCVAGISELFLETALHDAIRSFPFTIINFHSDNGSEFINKTVARLLNKLTISQTKSRSRKTNDNALVEGKNAAVIRKVMGHGHIPQTYAADINRFYQTYHNPHVNFHRKCAFATDVVCENGRIIKRYRHNDYRTPYQKFVSLVQWERFLVPGVTPEILHDHGFGLSHVESARILDEARTTLFSHINRR